MPLRYYDFIVDHRRKKEQRIKIAAHSPKQAVYLKYSPFTPLGIESEVVKKTLVALIEYELIPTKGRTRPNFKPIRKIPFSDIKNNDFDRNVIARTKRLEKRK